MISLAVNASIALEKLLKKVNPPVEYLKLPSLQQNQENFKNARHLRPVLLHGWGVPHHLGMPQLPNPERLRQWAVESYSPQLTVRLDFQPEDLNILKAKSAVKRAKTNAEILRQTASLKLNLENVAYYTWSERPLFVTDPMFIADVLAATDCNLTLDLAHARVAAHHRRESIEKYLAALPLEQVTELNLSGAQLEPDGMRDRHLPLHQDDQVLLQQILPRLNNLKIISLSYGGISDTGYKRDGTEIRLNRNDPSVLLEQLAKLDTLRKQISGNLHTAPTLPVGWHLDKRWRYQTP